MGLEISYRHSHLFTRKKKEEKKTKINFRTPSYMVIYMLIQNCMYTKISTRVDDKIYTYEYTMRRVIRF